MILINIVLFCVSTFLVQNVVGEPPKFRVLAPPFVCPKDKDAVIDNPDHTIIILQTEARTIPVKFHWIVRGYPLVAPTQRFTLALWNTVRELELKLNDGDGPALKSNVFVINNSELLTGVNYIFNVTATTYNDDVGTEEVFQIEYNKGDPKLLIEGQSDMFSVILIGGQLAFFDIDFTLEAQVTQCYGTQDYYFVWTVTSGEHNVAVSDVKGSRLVLRPNTLIPGQSYDVLCQVYKYSNGDFITQNSLSFRVLHRSFSIHFNVDLLVVSLSTPFKLYTDINKLYYMNQSLIMRAWKCMLGAESAGAKYKTDKDGTMSFPLGLFYTGEYELFLSANLRGQSESEETTARVIAQNHRLPVIQMLQMPRILNEGSVATFKAKIKNVVPGCSITWYFKSQHCLVSDFSSSTDICADNVGVKVLMTMRNYYYGTNSEMSKKISAVSYKMQYLPDENHGTRISEPINFYSLEKNFLSELTDYTKETSWKTVSANMNARAGRVRVVVECRCVKEHNCTSDGEVYADVFFQLNDKPVAKTVSAMPHKGTAMETVFLLSTPAVVDTNRPLRYSFFVDLTTNDTLLLGSYLEHMAIETLLPFIEGLTFVWVEVCDSLGACSTGAKSIVWVAPGEARTLEVLLEDVRAHVRRCELMMLRRLTTSAVVTYTNADQAEALSTFTTSLLNALGDIEEKCIESNDDQYNELIYWLKSAGIDTTKLV